MDGACARFCNNESEARPDVTDPLPSFILVTFVDFMLMHVCALLLKQKRTSKVNRSSWAGPDEELLDDEAGT